MLKGILVKLVWWQWLGLGLTVFGIVGVIAGILNHKPGTAAGFVIWIFFGLVILWPSEPFYPDPP